MDPNFSDLKKEAAATSENIFGGASNAATAATKKVKDACDDLLDDFHHIGDKSAGNVSSGAQDDNAHTEHYFANEQKNVDFVDPQAFVQRMSAGAKEAQEQLDAKFANAKEVQEQLDARFGHKKDDFDNFLSQASMGAKQGISNLTHDFMNAERAYPDGVFSAPLQPFEPRPADTYEEDVEDLMGKFNMPAPPEEQQQAAFAPSAPAKSQVNKDDDFFGKPPAAANKDSDTDSPSVSYTPSPAKKPITVTLKEQDQEQFKSSEDLLRDFKEPRTATPPVVAAPAKAAAAVTSLVTDLDDDDFKPSFASKPPSVSAPVKAVATPVVPAPAPVSAAAATAPAPARAPAPPPKAEPPKQKPAVAPAVAPQQQQQQPKIVSVEEIFYKYGLDAWFKPERLHPQVESLIYWRDVKKSGIVFGAGLVILLAISCFSVISVFAYLSLLALFGTVAFRIYKSVTQAVQKTNDGHPFKEYLDLDLTLSQEKVQNIAGVAVAHLNGFVAELRRLFLVEDLIDSIKFGVLLWVFTYIGAWFNGMTLVILAFVSLFTLPKVYENNKQSIDTYLDLVRSKLTEVTDKIKVAIPIGNKKPVVAAAESDKDK